MIVDVLVGDAVANVIFIFKSYGVHVVALLLSPSPPKDEELPDIMHAMTNIPKFYKYNQNK